MREQMETGAGIDLPFCCMKLAIAFYTREGCGLCREAKAELEALGWTIPLTIREVDITSDPELEKAYFDRIPVIEFASYHFEAPIDGQQLEISLRKAALKG
jgi:hypothetical protein